MTMITLIPSRGRPQAVQRMGEAFTATGADDTPVVWALDSDDRTADAYRAAVAEHMPYATVLVVDSTNMRMAINLAARQLVTDPGVAALAVLNDDHLPETVGWHERMLAELRAMGTGVVYPDDGIRGERLCTVWAMTADIPRTIGQVVPLLVSHMMADDAVMALARAAGCLRYLGAGDDPVRIVHHHPVAQKAAWDPVYARGHRSMGEDRAIFKRWLDSPKRDRQVAAVKALVAAHRVPDDDETACYQAGACTTEPPCEDLAVCRLQRPTGAPMLLQPTPRVVAVYARCSEPDDLVEDLHRNLAPWVAEIIEHRVTPDDKWTHEGDRNAAMRDLAKRAGAGWMLHIDPDERIADIAAQLVPAALADADESTVFGFPLREMWTPTQWRVDGPWGQKRPRYRLFHLHARQRFASKPIHSGVAPQGTRLLRVEIAAPLYHLKNIEPANRVERARAYLAADPNFRYQKRERPELQDWSWLYDETGLELADIEPELGFTPPYQAGSYLFVAPGGAANVEGEAQGGA